MLGLDQTFSDITCGHTMTLVLANFEIYHQTFTKVNYTTRRYFGRSYMQLLKDIVIIWKEPIGGTIMVFCATRSVKRFSERISIKVCGVVSSFMSGL